MTVKSLILFLLVPAAVFSQKDELPFSIDSLYDFSKPATLGLPLIKDAETYTIFSPSQNDNKYNHGVVLYFFKNRFYAQWQSSSKDEDAKDTRVFYSTSVDGKIWESPTALTDTSPDNITTSGGWWSYGDTLIAFINRWPKDSIKHGCTEYVFTTDGKHWSRPSPITDSNGDPIQGVIEQDLHALPDGRIITAFHLAPGLQAFPFYTDHPSATSGWHKGIMPGMTVVKNTSRGIEPGWFYRKDGAIVMVFRDQKGSFKKLASVSKNKGVTWSAPILINAPDSRAKQSAGNLPNGTAYMINNPSGNKNRFPLVITLSNDGFRFNKAFLIRSGNELTPVRYPGLYKREGYSYPKSIVIGKYLYIGYATNKEDVQVTRIKIDQLK